jgi:hypothetical protein
MLELLTLQEHLSSTPVFSGVRVTRSIVLWVWFVDRCLALCTISSGHCVVCSSIYGFRLPLWYLQTLLTCANVQMQQLKIRIWYLCTNCLPAVNRIKSETVQLNCISKYKWNKGNKTLDVIVYRSAYIKPISILLLILCQWFPIRFWNRSNCVVYSTKSTNL